MEDKKDLSENHTISFGEKVTKRIVNDMKKASILDFIAKLIVVVSIVIMCTAIYLTLTKNDAKKPLSTSGQKMQGANRNAVTVRALKTSLSTIEQTIKLSGTVAPKSQINIYPETQGKVTRILKSQGNSVSRGQILAYVDPSKPGSPFALNPVLSTVNGTIVELPVKVGETVNTSTVIAKIGSLNALKITINVAEKYSIYLKTGQKAYISVNQMPQTIFTAIVYEISPVVDPTKRTIEVSLQLAEANDIIKSGMFVNVRLAIRQSEDTIVVPKTALKTYNTQDVVYIIEDGVAKRKEIVIGLTNDTEAEIKQGLSEGDTVITAGAALEGRSVIIAQDKKDTQEPSETSQKEKQNSTEKKRTWRPERSPTS